MTMLMIDKAAVKYAHENTELDRTDALQMADVRIRAFKAGAEWFENNYDLRCGEEGEEVDANSK